MTAPITAPAPTIKKQAQVKMLLAFCRSFWPRATEMGTDEPTPTRSAREKLMMTKGMARLRAANEVESRKLPTKMPSISWYSEEASMPTAPGREAMKNSFRGGVLENSAVESIKSEKSPFSCGPAAER